MASGTAVARARGDYPISRTARANRERAKAMNLGYVLFLTAAVVLAGYVLIGYLRLQSEYVSQTKQISRMESELNSLTLANDDAQMQAESAVDLEEIRRIAIGELGMIYATGGQIEKYADAGSDYVRQLGEIK